MQILSYTKSSFYRPDIDGLRAIAVVLVVLCHAFPDSFGGGFIGVDIFFAISGYLISSILFRDIGRNSFSFWDFYAKRSRRIFPALIFVLIVGLILGAFLLTPREYKELGSGAMFGSIFFENIRLARGIDYFGLEIARKPFMHLWSLGVEEQFYLVFPLLVFLSWKFLKGRIGILLCGLVIFSFITQLHYQNLDESRAYFWPHCRFWQLGAGVLLAYIHYQSDKNRFCKRVSETLEKNGNALSIIAFIGLLVASLSYGVITAEYPGWYALLPTICSVFLIGAGRNAYINRTLLSQSKVVYLGWLSYPIYLWHWLFLSIGFSLYAGKIPFVVTLMIIALTIAFAYISFNLIEVPIRQMKADKKMLFSTLIVLFSVGAISGLVSKFDGFPIRLNSNHLEILKNISNDRSVPKQHRCNNQYNFVCWSQSGKEDGNLLLIGNSHTEHLMNVFAQQAPENVRVDIYAAGGTRPLENVVSRMTEKQFIRDGKMHQVLEATKKSKAQIVVISNTWNSLNPNERVLLIDGSTDKFDVVFEKTLVNILNSGKKVVYLIDTPRMPNEMENCLGLRPVNIVKGSCSITKENYEEQVKSQREYFKKWSTMYPQQVFVLESGSAMCDSSRCSMLDAKGNALYTDVDHLTDFGAAIVSNQIWKLLAPIIQDTIMN